MMWWGRGADQIIWREDRSVKLLSLSMTAGVYVYFPRVTRAITWCDGGEELIKLSEEKIGRSNCCYSPWLLLCLCTCSCDSCLTMMWWRRGFIRRYIEEVVFRQHCHCRTSYDWGLSIQNHMQTRSHVFNEEIDCFLENCSRPGIWGQSMALCPVTAISSQTLHRLQFHLALILEGTGDCSRADTLPSFVPIPFEVRPLGQPHHLNPPVDVSP